MSCKNQSHISMCKRWHKQSSVCKWWHKQFSVCKRWHKRSRRVSDDIGRPIKLWHVSPINTCRSPTPKLLWIEAFLRHLRGDQDSEVKKLCKNQVLKPLRTSTPKSKNIRSRIIQNICLDPKVYGNQAQRSKKHQ